MTDITRIRTRLSTNTTGSAADSGSDSGTNSDDFNDFDDSASDVRGVGDGIYDALAQATELSRTVVVALLDGTRLNGVPVGFSPPSRRTRSPVTDLDERDSRQTDPHAHVCGHQSTNRTGEGTAVLIREEAGQTPYVVRLAHVVYVRALTARTY